MATALKIDTVFRAVDKASAPIKKVQKNISLFSQKTQKSLKISKKSIDQFDRKVKKMSANVKRNLKRVAVVGVAGLTAGVVKFTKEAQKIEDAVAGFTPLMGGVEKATKLVDRLNQEAATTPFQFEGIAGVAKQLLPVMNGSIEDTADTFRMLGDTAGGNIQKLESITRGYTKAMLKGKPDMEALNMIAEAGVPIFSEMSESMGISKEQLFEMSKQGKLTNKDLTKAFEKMTTKGGIFYKGMEISSKTLTGKMSTLKDNINLAGASIMQTMLPAIKKITDKLIVVATKIREWATANKEIIKQKLETVFTIVGKALSFLWEATKKIFTILKKLSPVLLPIVAAYIAYASVMKIAAIAQGVMTAAQWAMNTAMAANPIGLIIAGIVALITLIVILVKKIAKVAKKGGFFKKIGGLFKKFGGWMKKAWQVVKNITSKIWGAIKSMFEMIKKIVDTVLGHIRKTFYDLVYGVLYVIGGMMKGILKAGKFFAKLFGIDTTGIDNAINSIRDLQDHVKQQSHFAVDQTVEHTGSLDGVQSKDAKAERNQLDINVRASAGTEAVTQLRRKSTKFMLNNMGTMAKMYAGRQQNLGAN